MSPIASAVLSDHVVSAKAQPSVLVLAYPFPPIQVQMSPVVARLAAGLHQLGFAVDVICAGPQAALLPRDDSLLDYADTHCRRIIRLPRDRRFLRRAAYRLRIMRDFPDCMAQLNKSAFNAVMAASPRFYAAVLTVSPFHSINLVMLRVKQACPDLRWIAHFCDPWAANPLETRSLVRRWNAWREPQALRAADFVTHSSVHACEMVLKAYPFLPRERALVVPHVFDRALYPARRKHSNEKVTLRCLGTLFGRRTPTPFFRALAQVIARRPELRWFLRVELIGPMDRKLHEWEGFSDLPASLVRHRSAVMYLESLELMYDADLLLVIEADVAATPFVPSKVVDYMGADTPIIGIAPPGGCHEILDRLGCPTVSPNDVAGIAAVLELEIDLVLRGRAGPWCRDEVRLSFDLINGTAAFVPLILETLPK